MGIFHQRHENLLNLLITRGFFFSPIVLIKVSGYTRSILCYIPARENSEIKPAFTKYGVKHTHGSFMELT